GRGARFFLSAKANLGLLNALKLLGLRFSECFNFSFQSLLFFDAPFRFRRELLANASQPRQALFVLFSQLLRLFLRVVVGLLLKTEQGSSFFDSLEVFPFA